MENIPESIDLRNIQEQALGKKDVIAEGGDESSKNRNQGVAPVVALASTNSHQPAIAMPLLVAGVPGLAEIVPALLADESYKTQVLAAVVAHKQAAVFDIRHLLAWPDAERWAVIKFLAQECPDCAVRVNAEAEPLKLLDAVLAALVGPDDVSACKQGITAAVEAAVLVHPDGLSIACSTIAKRLEKLGVKVYTAAKLIKEAESLLKNSTPQNAEASSSVRLVRGILPTAPVSPEAIVPPGWEVDKNGIASGDPKREIDVIHAPILLVERLIGVDDGSENVRVAWLKDGQWQDRVVPREQIASSQKIIELASWGAPINSNNARNAVQFLADYEKVNLDRLPQSLVARQLGWQGAQAEHGFLWGTKLLSAVCEQPIEMTGTQDNATPQIVFRGADEGDEQLAAGFCEKGSWEEWRAAVAVLQRYPRVLLTIYVALVPPLLEILKADNFIFSLAGPTSQGKTITLRVGASCWGCPDERSPSSVMATWDSTRVWITRATAVMNHSPLIVDDTKRASDPKLVAQMLYDVASGRGKGRGSKEGLARNDAFRTVLLTTGEAQITSFSEDGGTRARVLELWSSPFEHTDAETAGIVNAINDAIIENYGHLGPRFVQFLIDNRDRWPEWQERYREKRTQYSQKAGTNSVAARLGAHLAAIELTAELVHEAVDLPWVHSNVVDELYDELVSESAEADRAAVALRHVHSWASSHRDDFWPGAGAAKQVPLPSNTSRSPFSGCAGRYALEPGNAARGYLAFYPPKLDEVLKDGGFEPEPIKRLWFDRGWLRTTGNRRQYRCRVGDQISYLVTIRQAAIEEVDPPGAVEDDDHGKAGQGWVNRLGQLKPLMN